MKCGQPATHKITKIIKGEVHEISLCDKHAQEFSPYLHIDSNNQTKIIEILQNILKSQQQEPGEETIEVKSEGPICANCKLTYAAYRKTLLLGCSDCYKAFETELLDDLRKIHGATSQDPHNTPAHTETKRHQVSVSENDVLLKQVIAVEAAAKPEPGKTPTTAEQIILLEAQLQAAITEEEYQIAAEIRDSIKTLKEQSEKPEE